MTLDAWLEANRERGLAELLELLRIPSVSTDPAHAADVARCASELSARLSSIGLASEVLPTSGHPVVYAEWTRAPGAPTVLVYGHYDVQPPDPLPEWRHPPFEPAIEDGAIVARGATDDKGQLYCHVLGLSAHLATSGRLPVNVKVIFEGEEEIGSPSLEGFLREHRDRLGADCVVVSDGHMAGPRRPSLTIALRGIAYVEVTVRGPSHDLHSGRYGGGVMNPAVALARMIARLHDDRGRIAIPGFYDRVRDLDVEDRAELAALAHDEAAWRARIGIDADAGEAGYSVLERITARPTLDVNGIWGGYTGVGSKTVIPARAHAKISCRLVPDQRPEEVEAMLRAYLTNVAPPGVRVEVALHHGARPVVADRRVPGIAAARRALLRVWGVPPVFQRAGGSIPVVASFKEVLGLDPVLMGLGLEDDRIHSPNERFRLENFHAGVRASAYLFEELGRT